MPRNEMFSRQHYWIGRMSDEQLHALEADLKESVPEVCDPRYDAIVGRMRVLLGGQEDAGARTRTPQGVPGGAGKGLKRRKRMNLEIRKQWDESDKKLFE